MTTTYTLESIIQTALLVPLGTQGAMPNEETIFGLPVLFWGAPGIGKSFRVRSCSKSLGLICEPIYPSTRAPEDFSGAPFVKNNEIVIECLLSAVRTLVKEGSGVLFIDEISCAVPAVQSALLSVVLERRVGDTVLPNKVRIISAANPPDQAAGGWELEPPMANRFMHYEVSPPSSEDWINWMRGHTEEQDSITAGEEVVKDSWIASWARAAGLVTGYMRSGGNLHKLPEQGHKDRGRAWPSPRTWEMATDAIATCYALNQPDMAPIFVRGCVGEGEAIAWTNWVREADLPDPREMCLNGWTPDKRRLDRTMAALTAMTGYVLGQKTKETRNKMAAGAWKVFKAADEAGQLDLVVPSATKLSQAGLAARPGENSTPETNAAAAPVMLRIGKGNMSDILKAT